METKGSVPRHVLWVEGKDDNAVVQSLCNQHHVPKESFRVFDKEGVEKLLEGFPVQLKASELERFGMVLDADADAQARWSSIRNVLQDGGYSDLPSRPDPEGTIVSAPDRPRFGVWLMPDNSTPGMLEDFAATLVPRGDFLWTYAAAALDGIPEEHRRYGRTERPKAHIHTWLAWQEGPGSLMGQAITKGDLKANAPLAQRFVGWLQRLFVE